MAEELPTNILEETIGEAAKEMQSPKKDKVRREEAERIVAEVTEGKDSDDDDSDDGEEPPPGEGLSEEIFEVETILEHMYDNDGNLFFQVRWKNYGPSDDSWEPADNLSTAAVAIQHYWDKNKDAPKNTPKNKKAAKSSKSSSASKSKAKKSSTSTRKGRSESKKSGDTSSAAATTTPRARVAKSYTPSPHSESLSDKDSSDDEPLAKKKSAGSARRPTKASLKSYADATPTKASSSSSSTLANSVRQTALNHRQAWLESDSDDDEDETTTKKNEVAVEEKQPVEEKEKVAKVMPKTSTPTKKDMKRKAKEEEKAEKDSVKKTKLAATSSSDATEGVYEVRGIGRVGEGLLQVIMVRGEHRRIVSMEEAHNLNSWSLVNYLTARIEFEVVGHQAG